MASKRLPHLVPQYCCLPTQPYSYTTTAVRTGRKGSGGRGVMREALGRWCWTGSHMTIWQAGTHDLLTLLYSPGILPSLFFPFLRLSRSTTSLQKCECCVKSPSAAKSYKFVTGKKLTTSAGQNSPSSYNGINLIQQRHGREELCSDWREYLMYLHIYSLP